MRELSTEVHIEQVRDGTEYKGHIHFGDSYKFQYELRCDQNVGALDELIKKDSKAAISQVHINLKNSESQAVPIPEEIEFLFRGLIMSLATEFYANPRTRDSNSDRTKLLAKHLADFGASMSIGMTQNHTLDGDRFEPILVKYFK